MVKYIKEDIRVVMENYRDKLKTVRQKIKDDKFDEDNKGRSIIRLNVDDADSILAKYNDDGQEIISSDMADFVNNLAKSVPIEKDIVLDIKCGNYSADKESRYKKAIVNYYLNEFADKDSKIKNNSKVSLLLFIVGIIGFVGLYLLRLFDVYWLIQDIVEVASWVFLWETVDVFFLNRGILKWKQKRDLKIIFADIKIRELKK